MNLQDLALFKGFIERETLREIYIRGYRRSVTFANNPSSIEKFLSEVKAEDAIKGAIKKFSINETFGFDFWENTNDNWLAHLKQGRTRHSYADPYKLKNLEGWFITLRENWDAAKSWLYEDVDKAFARMGYVVEKGELKKIIQTKFKIGDIIKGTISGDICKVTGIDTEHTCYLVDDDGAIDFNKEDYWELFKEESKEELPNIEDFSGVPEADDDLEFFELNNKGRKGQKRLAEDEMSLNFRSNSYKIAFNQTITSKIQKNQYKFVRLARNKHGEIVIQLHKVEGLSEKPVKITFNTHADSTAINAVINSKDLCTKLKTLLNLTGDYFTLKIQELYMDFDKANYKISK